MSIAKPYARCGRTFEDCRRDLQATAERENLFPEFEPSDDLSRGEMRLAAEVALGALVGAEIPTAALDRALNALAVLARG